ncbi:MAG: adenylate/guanylate cyclase domain-containing protein, partial [Betaproteobacteria bacterium]
TEEAFLGDDVLFEHAANLIHGMAVLRARELSTQPLMLTVLDPAAPQIVGGTAATARAWVRSGGDAENIDLASLRRDGNTVQESSAAYRALEDVERSATSRTLKSLLFADLAGFSRLPEQYTPRFVEVFLGTCRTLLDSLERPAVDANTRGDGLFVVFERTGDAAEFAVRLQQAMRAIDWRALGLAADTRARIGLHTGPVFRTFDPVMGKATFYGTHVNRTARLEPIVQPGQIFVTEAFAASLVAEGVDRFGCHYIGAMPLAKHAGKAGLYRLSSPGEA